MNHRNFFTGTLVIAAAMMFSVPGFSQEPSIPIHRSPSPPGAEVRIENLADGDVVPPTFTVKFGVSGMDIAPAGTQKENTGHHHLLIDIAELPDMNMPLPATDNIRHFGKGQTETELTLTLGQHTLQLLFADYAHVPHSPPVLSKKITITVKPPGTE